MRSLPYSPFALFLLLTVAVQASAEEWNRMELMMLLATPQGSEQHYTETKELAFLETSVVSQGRLVFTPPDQLLKQVEKPDVSRYEITGDTMTISHPGEANQVVNIDTHPLLRTFIDTLRAILAGDLKSLEHHYSLKLTGTRSAWQLHLSPLDSQLATLVESLIINGQGKQINQMITQEQGGDRTTLTLHDNGG
ncbi:LolA-related protein [Pseudomonadota bacterium]